MEATPTGRSGVHVAAPVDRGSKNESDCATTQSQRMAADHAAAPVLTLGNVMSVSVQVWSHLLFYIKYYFDFEHLILCYIQYIIAISAVVYTLVYTNV